ncbi:N-acetylmuramoyl-L-alanine amidase [Profundibacterium mesophilum]|nr:N-acetylmuramoyl-L-alanine amidase [Profundibacterium mesophilum]
MIRVTDHAVLRYLERVRGVDVEAARAEIAAKVAVERLIEALGDLETERLLRRFGGAKIRIPHEADGGKLAAQVGVRTVDALIEAFGPGAIVLPMGEFRGQAARRRRAAWLLSEGRTIRQVALACDLHQRSVERISARMRDERQMRLPFSAMRLEHHHIASIPMTPARTIGGPIVPELVVVHDTAGRLEAGNSARYLAQNDAGVSVHFVVERGGEIVQQVPTNRRAGHAGRSHYQADTGGARPLGGVVQGDLR